MANDIANPIPNPSLSVSNSSLPPISTEDERHLVAIRGMVEETVAGLRGGIDLGNLGDLMQKAALGQRLLSKIIPYTERLGRNGQARRAAMVHLLTVGKEQQSLDPAVRMGFEAALLAVEYEMDTVIVSSLQDVSLLRASAGRIARFLLALFLRFARR
jgi:hypothetical protein